MDVLWLQYEEIYLWSEDSKKEKLSFHKLLLNVIRDAFTHKERSDCNKLLHSEHRHICKTVLSGMIWLCRQIIRNVRSNPIPGDEISNHVKEPWTWIFGGPWGGRVCSTLLGSDKHDLSLFWSPQKAETRPHGSGITTPAPRVCSGGCNICILLRTQQVWAVSGAEDGSGSTHCCVWRRLDGFSEILFPFCPKLHGWSICALELWTWSSKVFSQWSINR